MQLEKINKTNDIKKLNLKEKTELASEIREYLLDTISKTGGHIASNLGVVELTIALESVFDPKKDKIIWDVGHQCYTHKILNGRKKELKTIRQFKGISGFPKVSESPTDTFNTGHSSTSISAAAGIAAARDLNKKNYNVIAVIGDGALTGGMAMEALNHIGSSGMKVLVILNDNEMSISKNIGGINELLTKLRVKKKYIKSNKAGKKIISRIPLIGNMTVRLVKKIKRSIKQMFLPGMYFEEIGFRYLGPVDGHNISDMEYLFSKAKDLEGPTLIHVITTKGKGYEPAEENPDKFHGIGKFDVFTGETIGTKKDDYSKVFGHKLTEMAKKNKKIVAITAAMKDGTGLREFSTYFPKRFYDVGIAEQHALTFAAGLASQGLIPFISIYSSFYQRGYDQVIHDICAQNLPVIMCVDRAGIVGADGETHQGMFDLSFFKLIPNLVIMAPSNFKDLELMMELAPTLNKPVVIRYPRGGEGTSYKPKAIKLGKAELVEEGNDVSIISIGRETSKALDLSNLLKQDNITSDIINVRFLKPLDTKTILNSIEKTKNIVVIEDGTIVGGLCSSIKELIADNKLEVNAKYYGFPDKFIEHGSIDELEKEYKQDLNTIYSDVIEMIKK